eukprot:tig00000147_g9500.t1
MKAATRRPKPPGSEPGRRSRSLPLGDIKAHPPPAPPKARDLRYLKGFLFWALFSSIGWRAIPQQYLPLFAHSCGFGFYLLEEIVTKQSRWLVPLFIGFCSFLFTMYMLVPQDLRDVYATQILMASHGAGYGAMVVVALVAVILSLTNHAATRKKVTKEWNEIERKMKDYWASFDSSTLERWRSLDRPVLEQLFTPHALAEFLSFMNEGKRDGEDGDEGADADRSMGSSERGSSVATEEEAAAAAGGGEGGKESESAPAAPQQQLEEGEAKPEGEGRAEAAEAAQPEAKEEPEPASPAPPAPAAAAAARSVLLPVARAASAGAAAEGVPTDWRASAARLEAALEGERRAREAAESARDLAEGHLASERELRRDAEAARDSSERALAEVALTRRSFAVETGSTSALSRVASSPSPPQTAAVLQRRRGKGGASGAAQAAQALPALSLAGTTPSTAALLARLAAAERRAAELEAAARRDAAAAAEDRERLLESLRTLETTRARFEKLYKVEQKSRQRAEREIGEERAEAERCRRRCEADSERVLALYQARSSELAAVSEEAAAARAAAAALRSELSAAQAELSLAQAEVERMRALPSPEDALAEARARAEAAEARAAELEATAARLRGERERLRGERDRLQGDEAALAGASLEELGRAEEQLMRGLATARRLREAKLAEHYERIRRETEALKKARREADVSCRICCSNEIKTVLLPCGHACVCRGCGAQCEKCPICRSLIESRHDIYVG